MFYNLRYVSIVVTVVMTIVAMIAGIYLQHYILEHVVHDVGQSRAEASAKLYIQNVWNRYYPVIAFVSNQSQEARDALPQYASYSKETDNFFSDNGLVGVTILDKNGISLYQTAQRGAQERPGWLGSLLGENITKKLLTTAIGGKASGAILTDAAVINGESKTSHNVLRVMIPIAPTQVAPEYQSAAQLANAVLMLDYDISANSSAIAIIMFVLILGVSLSFATMSIAIIGISRRAEMLLEKQQESAVEMSAAKAEAESENRNKSKFLANISHELRTPLNAIIGFSEIISSESMGPIENPKYKEFIKDIHTSGQHLLSLINDILDYSKAEENKLVVDHEEVDITKVIQISMRMLSPRAEEAKVQLVEEVPADHILVIADPKRIKQVLLNLLSNSVKFTPEGGQVSVKLSLDNEAQLVTVEVHDTGVGMEPQDLARALAPFGQIDNKLSRRYDGTGLGLPLTKKLVELMNGKFDIKSEIGLGTTVVLKFQIANDASKNSTPTASV